MYVMFEMTRNCRIHVNCCSKDYQSKKEASAISFYI